MLSSILPHLVFFALLLGPSFAEPLEVQRRVPGCADPQVKSLVSIVKSAAPDKASKFCSSYLQYTEGTRTITATKTHGTITVTTTKTVTKPKPKREAPDLAARAPVPAPPTLTADSAGKVSGFPSGIVSAACSCVVPKPTKTSTLTKTVTVPVTKTITKTVTKTQSASTTTSTTTTMITSTRVVGCSGPDPTFYIQFQDGNPSRPDDQYTGQYLSVAPDTYRGTGEGYIIETTTSLLSAKLLTLECSTGRLKTVAESWFAEVDYFVSLGPVYFDTAAFIEPREFQYLECGVVAGALSCYVQYPDAEFSVGR